MFMFDKFRIYCERRGKQAVAKIELRELKTRLDILANDNLTYEQMRKLAHETYENFERYRKALEEI